MKTDTESNQPKRILLSDYKAPSFRIKSIDLHFDLYETATKVKATQIVEKIENAPLILNGELLKLESIKIDGKILAANEYAVEKETLTIHATPQQFTLEIIVTINPEENKACTGLYLSKGIFATQCEAEGFRNITYFLDRPDVMTSYAVTIEADKKKYPVLLSNGDLISKKDLDGGKHQAVWKDPFKKPSYLFALVAGDIGVVSDTFKTMSGREVKLEVYASHGKQSRCYHALESLKKSMKWDEERFGLEYDLNTYMIVSIDDFNMGAMENKGLNIFNSRLVLADPESATDTDFDRIESVVGHEYFHNWTGNRVTCRNWFELSLKEGLTVFRDQEFSSDLNSRAVQRIKDVDALRGSQFAEDAGPNSHPVRPESCLAVDNFYTPTIYEKGSEVIRMMQTIVGTKGFRHGMDEYFKRHDGQAVTIIDFADAIATPNKADFSQFKLWYSQSGTPEVSVTEAYDSSKKEYTLTLTQTCAVTEKQPVKKPFHIPLLIGLIDSKGNNIAIKSKDVTFNTDEKAVVHLKQATQSFVFTDVNEKPVLSLNREFSAPIKLNWKATQAELLHLIKYDSDSFNRREASFKMTLQELQRLIGCYHSKTDLTAKPEIVEALGHILKDSSIDPQFKALMLQLPDDDILAQEENVLDAVAFNKAYQTLVTAFVTKYETDLITLYFKHHLNNTSGDRALKNKILRFLIDAKNSKSVAMAFEQFNSAKNMTDKLSAMMSLCQTDAPEKDKALAAFFERWKDDAVVFNKWLQVQSSAALPSAFETVKKITQTAPFSLENPNNIYSLHGIFGDNYLAMQKPDGSTFKWLCDEILKIDKKNPQVAARVCGCFNFVKKYPENLKVLAQTEIKRVLAEPTLSKNSRELLEGCV
ncbi:aminopeptidase N [bacterium]|nr:aminopeptidase N [bacterium]